MNSRCLFVSALAIGVLTGPRAFGDNAILYWNNRALDATRLARNPPPLSSFFFAVFHAAIFDAVNGITRTHHGSAVNDPAPAGIDRDAAIAGAAHATMIALWSATSNPHNLQVAYENALATIPDGPARPLASRGASTSPSRSSRRSRIRGTTSPSPGSTPVRSPGNGGRRPPNSGRRYCPSGDA